MATPFDADITQTPPGAGASSLEDFGGDGFPDIDMAKVYAFSQKVLGDFSGALVSLVGAIGDRLGLFKDLAFKGPATSAELAARTYIHERYAREWLRALLCAGYLEYDAETERFALPVEHAAIVAQEGSMTFLGGGYQQLLGFTGPLDQLITAFRTGAGIPQEAYNENLLEGMERMSAGWFENLLVPVWIAALPHVQAALERGIAVADVGCGSGRALIKLAQAFPRSRFVGYDVFEGGLARARANANAAGVTDRVRFEQRDVIAEGLPEAYDLITTFDAVHDFADVAAGLTAIRQALREGGSYLMLEMNSANRLEDNAGPVGAVLYGTSVLYNLPVARSHGGEGLGTMGLPESRVRQLCAAAGFGTVQRLPLDNPFNIFYEIKP
ncbi:MAG TPA: methyltransferase [Rhodothermales bacterium]|nr:methyltransferase [Rhodothermales bacterium]